MDLLGAFHPFSSKALLVPSDSMLEVLQEVGRKPKLIWSSSESSAMDWRVLMRLIHKTGILYFRRFPVFELLAMESFVGGKV